MIAWVKTLFAGSKWIGIAGTVLVAGLTLFLTIQYIQNVGELKSKIEYQQEQIEDLEKRNEVRQTIDEAKRKAPRDRQEAEDFFKNR